MKALKTDERFLELAHHFVLAGLTTRPGLFTTANNAYFLFLDAEGREQARLMDEQGETGSQGKAPLKQIASEDVIRTMKAVLAQRKRGVAGDALLAHLLRDARTKVRRDAARMAAGARHASVVPELIALLADPDPGVLSAAAAALRAQGHRATDAIPALRTVAANRALPVLARTQAVTALAQIGPDSALTESVLTSALRDEDRYIVIAAARGIAEASPRSVRLVPVLMEAWLRHERSVVRMYIAYALAHYHRDATAALPLLREARGAKHEGLAKAAIAAVQEIEKR